MSRYEDQSVAIRFLEGLSDISYDPVASRASTGCRRVAGVARKDRIDEVLPAGLKRAGPIGLRTPWTNDPRQHRSVAPELATLIGIELEITRAWGNHYPKWATAGAAMFPTNFPSSASRKCSGTELHRRELILFDEYVGGLAGRPKDWSENRNIGG